MDIFAQIKKLNFPSDQYVVAGSGIMGALGLKEVNDLDIVVTPELFEKAKASGWKSHPWTHLSKEEHEWLSNDDGVELYMDVNYKDVRPTFDELKRDEVVISDVPFISLQQLLKFKRAYQREKDFKDVALIEKYLENKR